MEDLETSLRTFILQRTEISSVIVNKFVWNFIPQGMEAPLIRAKTVSDAPIHNRSSKGLGKALVQLDIFHTDKASCNQLALTIRNLFDGYTGVIGNFDTRVLVKDAPSDWYEDIRKFMRTGEMEIGYVG